MTVHEEDYLDLPELNKRKIEENRWAIVQNRLLLTGICVLAITVSVGSFIVLNKKMEVSIHECEQVLWNKVVEQGYVVEKDKYE